jgi:hypothetical protein
VRRPVRCGSEGGAGWSPRWLGAVWGDGGCVGSYVAVGWGVWGVLLLLRSVVFEGWGVPLLWLVMA